MIDFAKKRDAAQKRATLHKNQLAAFQRYLSRIGVKWVVLDPPTHPFEVMRVVTDPGSGVFVPMYRRERGDHFTVADPSLMDLVIDFINSK